MAEVLAAHHIPAVKVGGRRLSVSSRPHKNQTPSTPAPPESNPDAPTDTDTDYPRPVAHADVHTTHQPPPAHEEDMPSKKDKKHLDSDAERHLQELAQRKAESARPSKDLMTGNRGFGAAGRISQPAGRSLGI